MRILLIEDDVEAADYIAQGLRDEGHELYIAPHGRNGLFQATGGDWDLLIIDRMLPGLEGLTLTRTLRAGGIATPVLFLTALGGLMTASPASMRAVMIIWSSPLPSRNSLPASPHWVAVPSAPRGRRCYVSQ